jgi:predicted AAA+ superfamily ATPase
MMAMYPRELELPERSFFLFGPRGTGKTTWLRERLPRARWFDLLLDRVLVQLTRDPGRFSQEVEALPKGTWVVVDEVQRLPALLNEVQDLMARRGSRYRFALTGSSARKLRRGGANLLPARVVNRRFFPLTAGELGSAFDHLQVLRFGSLPAVCSASDERSRIELLEAYAENYLTQEIRDEALVKRLDSFTRFLDVAATMNAQVVNVAAIARDAAVARPTVRGFFEVLVDTLVGTWLPAWRPRAKVKEVGHPKFYFFDTGVVRSLAGRLREPLGDEERGHLLETYVLHELRAHLNRSGCGGELAYWRTRSGAEVDFIWTRGSRSVGIEAKSGPRWRPEDGAALETLLGEGRLRQAFGVYLGDRPLRIGDLLVLPLVEFLAALRAGDIVG